MTQRHNIPEITPSIPNTPGLASQFGITAEHVGAEIALELDEVTYEGEIVEVHHDSVVLVDYTRSAPDEPVRHGSRTEPITVVLTQRARVWLDVHEDDFITDETGAVTLPGGPITLDD